MQLTPELCLCLLHSNHVWTQSDESQRLSARSRGENSQENSRERQRLTAPETNTPCLLGIQTLQRWNPKPDPGIALPLQIQKHESVPLTRDGDSWTNGESHTHTHSLSGRERYRRLDPACLLSLEITVDTNFTLACEMLQLLQIKYNPECRCPEKPECLKCTKTQRW